MSVLKKSLGALAAFSYAAFSYADGATNYAQEIVTGAETEAAKGVPAIWGVGKVLIGLCVTGAVIWAIRRQAK